MAMEFPSQFAVELYCDLRTLARPGGFAGNQSGFSVGQAIRDCGAPDN
jgi:hypothetical protein